MLFISNCITYRSEVKDAVELSPVVERAVTDSLLAEGAVIDLPVVADSPVVE